MTASVIVIFSRASESKTPPIGLCSPTTISIGVVRVMETLEVCFPGSAESPLIDELCSVMVVVLVVVILEEVEDSGDRLDEYDRSEDVGESKDNVDVKVDGDESCPALAFDVEDVTYDIFETVLESEPADSDVSLMMLLDASDGDVEPRDNDDNVWEADGEIIVIREDSSGSSIILDVYVVDVLTMDTFDPPDLFVGSASPCFVVVVVVVEDAAAVGDVRTDNDDVAIDAGDGSELVLNVNVEDFTEASGSLPGSVVASLLDDVGISNVREDVPDSVLLLDVIVVDTFETVGCLVDENKLCLVWSLIVSG